MKGVTERQKAILARWRVEQLQAEAALTPEERLREASELTDLLVARHGIPDTDAEWHAWVDEKKRQRNART